MIGARAVGLAARADCPMPWRHPVGRRGRAGADRKRGERAMNCTSGDAKALFYRLLPPDEQYAMNLFSLILSDERALAWTDGRYYLAAQSSDSTPLWLWLAHPLPDRAVNEAAHLLSERLAPGVRFIADPARIPPVLERLKCAQSRLQPRLSENRLRASREGLGVPGGRAELACLIHTNTAAREEFFLPRAAALHGLFLYCCNYVHSSNGWFAQGSKAH